MWTLNLFWLSENWAKRRSCRFTGQSMLQPSNIVLWEMTKRMTSQIRVAESQEWLGSPSGIRWGAQIFFGRVTDPLHKKWTFEVVQASGQDAFFTPSNRGVSDMSLWEAALGQTQEFLERLYLSTGMGISWGCRGLAGGGGWGKGACYTSHTVPRFPRK